MDTKIVILDENNIDKEGLKEAGTVLKHGGLVAFPTETVYGLGANALDSKAVKKIFEVKGRPQDNPLIVHIADFSDLDALTEDVPKIAYKIMNKFWPGPLTVILKKSELIPNETSAGLNSVGIRMPANKIAIELIKASGVPIAAPSANVSGRPSPTVVERCIEDLNGKVDYIIGGGSSEVGVESTIVDCTEYPPCILRPGGITLEMLKEIDENVYVDASIMKKNEGDFRPKAPGMKYRHYAPKAQVKIVQGDLQKTIAKINEMVQNYRDEKIVVAIMASDETEDKYLNTLVKSLGSRKNPENIAKNLFETLRILDDQNVDIIITEAFEEIGVGLAVMNRLKKSAGFDIIKV